MYRSSKRRGEDGIAAIIDFLLSNAQLVLGVGGVAVLGIATLAVKKVRTRPVKPFKCALWGWCVVCC